jgi:signal transduction histidine kinase
MTQTGNTTEIVIIGTTIVVLLLAMTLVFLFIFIQRKKKSHFEEKRKFQENFSKELARSRNEIREKALENISWEIHDNVGQLLSVAKLQLNRLETKIKPENKDNLLEITNLVSKSLQDLRALSKSLNPVSIKNIGLLKALELELDRYNRLNFIKANLKVVNKPFRLRKERETILFRILQEFIHNTIKHAKASEINVLILYQNDEIEIVINDNGIGFDINKEKHLNGIGLLNMKGRAELIKAELDLTSKINEGTSLFIKCKKETENG